MKTLVSALFAFVLLASGCQPEWYETKEFESFYYGLQEASVAITGEPADTLYFIDTDMVSRDSIALIRQLRCEANPYDTAECIRVAEIGSIGSEVLFGQSLVEFRPRPPKPGPIGPKWDPFPRDLRFYDRFTCLNRTILIDEIPDYLGPDDLEEFDQAVPLFDVVNEPPGVPSTEVIGVEVPALGPETSLSSVALTQSASSVSFPNLTRVTINGGPCEAALSRMICTR